MSDAYVRGTLLASPLEAEKQRQGYNEAFSELVVWATAVLDELKTLF